MITAALTLGLVAWLTMTFGGVVQLLDNQTEQFEKGVGCVMVPLSFAAAAFIGASFFWLYGG